jgi:hypothetical protein
MGKRLKLGLLGVLAASVALAATAAAHPSAFAGPIFGLATARDGGLLVADSGRGIVKVDAEGHSSLLASLPGVTDIAPASGRDLWAVTSGEPGAQQLFRVSAAGTATLVAKLRQFEERQNPHPAEVDSNPYAVADLGRGQALVADAGGNDLLRVEKNGKVHLVAVLPDEIVSTENAKRVARCPNPPEDLAFVCKLPASMPAEAVPTSVVVGPDGAYYVGELKGFPAPIGKSKVWRIEPSARAAECGKSPRCSVALDGLTSVIDLAFGRDGRLDVAQIDDASFLAAETGSGAVGGSVHACNLKTKRCETVVSGKPTLTGITFRQDGSLWGTTNALIPGAADVVKLTP